MDKSKGKISQNFVAFSEYMNFKTGLEELKKVNKILLKKNICRSSNFGSLDATNELEGKHPRNKAAVAWVCCGPCNPSKWEADI